MTKTVSVFTLGCKTNSYESGQIMNLLAQKGYTVKEGLHYADIFILNTCAVTAEAEGKSRQAVARLRKLNPNCQIIITGCAAEKNAEQFAGMENVTLISGNAKKGSIVDAIDEIGIRLEKIEDSYYDAAYSSQPKTRAYVKIQDGCNNFCSYCIVPYLRGASRSRSIESIYNEIKSTNSYEYVLIGIDISQYGRDTGTDLAELLLALKDIKARIRMGSLYCEVVDKGFLDAMQYNVCPHLHLSLQSGSDKVLKDMNRRYTTQQYYEAVQLIREKYPNSAITTDIIVGYPTETETEFLKTMEFAKKVAFSDIHLFPYSPRKGTEAYSLGKLPSDIVKDRVKKLTEVKNQLRTAFLQKNLNISHKVLIEENKDGYYTGYTENYIRVYIKEKVEVGRIYDIVLKEPYKEGALGEL